MAEAHYSEFTSTVASKIDFGSVVSIGSGGTPKTSVSTYWNGDIPFFSPKDACGYFIHNTEKQITENGLSNCNSKLYPRNTTFITARGTVGKVCIASKPMAMNQSCYAIISKSEAVFTTHQMCLHVVKSLKHKASGAVFDAITAEDIKTETRNG